MSGGPRRARFHHPHLFADDIDAALAFYRRWFGAEVVADHAFAGSRNIMVAVGDGHLNFYDQPPRDHGRNAVHHLGFQVDDLAGLVAEMSAAGLPMRSAIRELPELDYVMVEGPDGVLLELFEYKPGPPRPGLDPLVRLVAGPSSGRCHWLPLDSSAGMGRITQGEQHQ